MQPIFVVWFKAEPILLALNQEPEVAQLAALYLRCASLGLPAYTFNCIVRYFVNLQAFSGAKTDLRLQAIFPISRVVRHPDENHTRGRTYQRIPKLAIRWVNTLLIGSCILPLISQYTLLGSRSLAHHLLQLFPLTLSQ